MREIDPAEIAASWTDAELLGRARMPIAEPLGDLHRDLVLLDRDGTLNRLRPGYVTNPDKLDTLPQAAESVRRLNDLGARVVLVTNQRGLARGLLSEEQLVAVHRRLILELAQAGAHLDGIHVCGHEEGQCDCRKPNAGLIRQVFERASWAAPNRALLVGDSTRDEGAARNAGIDFIRIDEPEKGLAQKIDKVLVLCAHSDRLCC